MEEFFRSVRESFAQNRARAEDQSEYLAFLLGLCVLALLALQLVVVVRRFRGLRLDVEQLASQRGFTREELAFVLQLTRASKVPAMKFLTHLDVFESLTARALRGEIKGRGWPPEHLLGQRVRRIREALNFDRLPPHTPLLTTRELSAGTGVDLGATHGQVFDVNESSFRVELRQGTDAPLEPNQAVTLLLTHAREARYQLSCRVLEVKDLQLVLAHDEAPTRVQQRELARVSVSGQVTLRALSWPGPSLLPHTAQGKLTDVGGGGACITCPSAFPPGAVLAVSFSVAEQPFLSLRSVVLACRPKEGFHELNLEFSGLPPAEKERLISALTKAQLHQLAASRRES